mmetsp:Transcript_4806/g.5489  ORF Transcript_4806/g.5489 Transcript_4806/m.5489 type:complete len:313 (-) Transcript_4806:273-1211(-)
MFAERAKNAIPCEIRMISGCEDKQTSADVSNVASFKLPDPAGRAGGACTSAILNVLYADKKKPDGDLSFKDVLLQMRGMLDGKGFDQIPQLSASRNLDVDSKFDITPDNFSGTKRAVMIGINYVGQDGELAGCHNDVLNMKEYLMDVHEFEEDNMMILMDDGEHVEPNQANILSAYRRVVALSQPGDVVYLHYSGHGGKLRDDNNDEDDGYDETLIPLDYNSAGQIRDDDLLRILVLPMQAGVYVTSVMDCCHSGTVLDLPYNFKGDGEQESMNESENFDFSTPMGILSTLTSNASLMNSVASAAEECCTIS